MKVLLNAFIAILFIAYPFFVFIGLQYIEPRLLALLLIGVIALRFFLSRNLFSKIPWLKLATGLGGIVVSISILSNGALGIKLYPIAVNFSMLCVFAYSLYKKPCIIETFARIKEPDLDIRAVNYTEKVTKVWVIFFIINILLSWYTAFFLSNEMWVLYNGLIAYILIGIIMLVEWCVRCYVKKKHQGNCNV